MEQVQSFTEEHRSKLAGVCGLDNAEHLQLTVSADIYPVTIWSEIWERYFSG